MNRPLQAFRTDAPMLLIPCPWCGLRDQDEFSLSSEASKRRPKDPALSDDEDWAEFLYGVSNAAGPTRYRACHTIGCGLWFTVSLDSISHAIGDSRELEVDGKQGGGAR